MRKRSVLSGTNEASSPEMCLGKLEAGRCLCSSSDPPRTDGPLQTSHISAFLLLPSTVEKDVMIADKQCNICIANSNISLASLREVRKSLRKCQPWRWFRGSAERSSTVSLSCNRLFICLENNEENNPNNSCHILSVYCG